MEGWSCWLGDTKVTTNLYPTIVKHIYWQKMKEHCQLKEGLEPEAFDLVEWDAIDDAANMLPMLFNLWKMKQVSGFCGVGKNMKCWGFWEDSCCLSCDELREDAKHILYCPHQDRITAWMEVVDGFEAWMEEVNTAPAIWYCLVTTLQARDPRTIFCAYEFSTGIDSGRGAG